MRRIDRLSRLVKSLTELRDELERGSRRGNRTDRELLARTDKSMVDALAQASEKLDAEATH